MMHAAKEEPRAIRAVKLAADPARERERPRTRMQTDPGKLALWELGAHRALG
jgi:hypothetical protein